MKIAIFPGRYVQGAGVLARLAELASELGKKALVVAGRTAATEILRTVEDAWRPELEWEMARFGGECSEAEIERLAGKRREAGADFIIGMGGGKVLDTAKAVAAKEGVPVAIVPTIASTDAPCSAVSVIYTPEGAFSRYDFHPRSPDLVLVDTAVIARAPVRYLLAGIGDGLSTWFEAETCYRAYQPNQCGGLGTLAGQAIARQCLDTLYEHSEAALAACRRGVVTPALDHIVEANTLLSGIGFESAGLASAHAIHNGLTQLDETHDFLHGEKVVIGVLAGLFLGDRPRQMIREVFGFCRDVGLPCRLSDIGVHEPSDEDLMRVAERACSPDDTMVKEPSPVTPADVVAALRTVDEFGAGR